MRGFLSFVSAVNRVRDALALVVWCALVWGVLVAGVGCDSPCQTAADCDAGKVCAQGACVVPAASTCVGGTTSCVDDAACGGGRCEQGCCLRPCSTRLDCASGERCAEGVCRADASGCSADGDCAATPLTSRCHVATGTCVACLDSVDCADPALTCNSERRCVLREGRCRRHSDCGVTPGTPWCDAATSTCVRCLLDADCSPAAPICDPTRHVCAECAFDGACPPGNRCARGLCVRREGGCADDTDCAPLDGTPRCRIGDRTCVACLQRSDCGPLRDCLDGACIPTRCRDDAECVSADPTHPVCDAGGACLQCRDDAGCGPGERCRSGACEPPGCADDGDCAATPDRPLCRAADRACVSCLNDAQCALGSECIPEGRCLSRPGIGEVCDAATPCPADQVCALDRADDPAATPVCLVRCPGTDLARSCGGGSTCAVATMGAGGMPVAACVSGVDLPAEGQPCASGRRCGAGLVCLGETQDGICRPLCGIDGACGVGQECRAVTWMGGDPASTAIPRTRACLPVDNAWGRACATADACSAGQVCRAGVSAEVPALTEVAVLSCQTPVGSAAPGQPCAVDADCQTGVCLRPTSSGGGWSTSTGVCARACQVDSECPTVGARDGACLDTDFTAQGLSGQAPLCHPACLSEYECRGADSCRVEPNHAGDRWATRCVVGNAASRGSAHWGGAACRADADCWSGRCLRVGSATTDGVCSGVCKDGSATGCAPGAQCPVGGVPQTLPGVDGRVGTADDATALAPLCWPKSCQKDGDCAATSADATRPRACGPTPFGVDQRDVLLACLPRQGDKKGGDVCAADAECATGRCVPWLLGSDPTRRWRCFGACQTRVDCVDSAINSKVRCSVQEWRAGSGRSMGLCVPTL